ncbi:Gfo/Idh/MocA family protein [Gracilibacillus sp. D59]|uniref:Gfo/Idh/MocA family protein n=1 Tax=Gracilibacillus sp. D59 TaxID=3457434 RepID=UPI003FCE9531
MPIKVGIVGLGLQGSKYASLIYDGQVKGMQLTAVSSRSSEKRDYAEDRYKDVLFYHDYRDLIKEPSVEAVIICVPHFQHVEVATASLLQNKHVLTEKPLSVHTKELEPLRRLAEEKPDLSFGIIFNQRAKPGYQMLKDLLEENAIGKIRNWQWTATKTWRPQAYYEQNEWRATWNGEGGGVLINQASHHIDLIAWLFGMPQKVYAHIKYGSQRDITVDDDVTTVLTYANGMSGVFTTRTHDFFGTDRLEILGDNGKIIIENGKSMNIKVFDQKEQLWSQGLDISEFKAIEENAPHYQKKGYEFREVKQNPYVSIMHNFSESITENTPLYATRIDGERNVELINAIYLSDWLQKEVEIPFDPSFYLEQLHKIMEKEREG